MSGRQHLDIVNWLNPMVYIVGMDVSIYLFFSNFMHLWETGFMDNRYHGESC